MTCFCHCAWESMCVHACTWLVSVASCIWSPPFGQTIE
jgi:hypothetical protein